MVLLLTNLSDADSAGIWQAFSPRAAQTTVVLAELRPEKNKWNLCYKSHRTKVTLF